MALNVFTFLVISLVTFILSLSLLWGIIKYLFIRKKINQEKVTHKQWKRTIGFFHPYCNAGGGGERVLWAAIRVIQIRYTDVQCIVYTGDTDSSKEAILKKVETQFNISLLRPVEFIFLTKRYWVEAERYPYFTLLFQSLGSIVLAIEALLDYIPDIYIDTMGYAFTLPLFKYLGGCKVGCYVHYPTISTDMLEKVSSRAAAHNNRNFVSRSSYLTSLKLFYYNVFAFLYGFVGKKADVIMVNSTWTKNHINSLWKSQSKTFLVFPPCDVSEFENIAKERKNEKQQRRILSVAQFRPEKDHPLQIKAFSELLHRLSNDERKAVKLVLVGSCRCEEDRRRVEKLQELSNKLGTKENVEFKINLSFNDLKVEMQNAMIALHTMWNEHFGIRTWNVRTLHRDYSLDVLMQEFQRYNLDILDLQETRWTGKGIVECMSAGLIMIAHNSGGPKLDIVVDYNGQKTGFLADDVNSYASTMESVLRMPENKRSEIIKNARASVVRFSSIHFEKTFLEAVQLLFL